MWDPSRSWTQTPGLPCRADPEAWQSDGLMSQKPSEAHQAHLDEIKARCKPCPVLAQCRRDGMGEPHGIWGGLDPHQRYMTRRAMFRAAKSWPKERRLRFGARVYAVRPDMKSQSTWLPVQRMTGLPARLAEELRQEYVDYMESHAAPARVPVKAPLSGPVWPSKPSSRHAWAWLRGRVVAAYYVAHSPDRRHVLVRAEGGYLSTITWLPAELVRIHAPQPIQTREMKASVNVHDHRKAA